MSGELADYHRRSRALPVSLLAILPLLAVYEIGILVTRSPVQNHAGLLVRRMIGLLGMNAYLGLTAAVAVTFLLALFAKRIGSARDFRDYWLMLLEAVVYAAVLGPLVHLLEGGLPRLAAGDGVPGKSLRVILYLGAGVWEELVFRLLLLGGFVWIATRVAHGNRVVFSVLGLLVSGALFALFHHVGELGEPFVARVFVYRLLSGAVLGTIFLLRGLGVTVYTHAFYNVGVLLLR